MAEAKVGALLEQIERHAPGLAYRQARILPALGQFNTVLCLDERWIIRFPKSSNAASDMAHELAILPRFQGRLPLAHSHAKLQRDRQRKRARPVHGLRQIAWRAAAA